MNRALSAKDNTGQYISNGKTENTDKLKYLTESASRSTGPLYLTEIKNSNNTLDSRLRQIYLLGMMYQDSAQATVPLLLMFNDLLEKTVEFLPKDNQEVNQLVANLKDQFKKIEAGAIWLRDQKLYKIIESVASQAQQALKECKKK
jgi:hypothetical protein